MTYIKRLLLFLLLTSLAGISCSDSSTDSGNEDQKLEHKFFDSQSTSTFDITKTVDGQVLAPSETPEFEEAIAFVNLDESKENIDGESYTGITFFLAPENYSGDINLVDDVKSPGLLVIKINDKQESGQITSQEEYLTLYNLASIDIGLFEATAYDSQVGAPSQVSGTLNLQSLEYTLTQEESMLNASFNFSISFEEDPPVGNNTNVMLEGSVTYSGFSSN